MQHLLGPLDLQPGEYLASIGAGGGVWEVGLGGTVPGLTIYLVELSAEVLNQTELEAAAVFWEKQGCQPAQSQFIVVIGTESNPNLSPSFFDKILISNAFHEFSQPAAMLAQCRIALKPGGRLFLEEPLARTPGERHEGCGKRLFTEPELIHFLSENGFRLRQSLRCDGSDWWKIIDAEPDS